MKPLAKTIATIAVANVAVVATLVMTQVANSLINSEDRMFAIVGLSTYAILLSAMVLTGYFLFRIWSAKS